MKIINPFFRFVSISALSLISSNFLYAATSSDIDLSKARVNNISAYIPPQCYTKTQDEQAKVHNPCYSCHTKNKKPNYLDDSDLQLDYALPAPALINPWTNLFVDRQDEVNAITDNEVLQYIRKSNYLSESGEIILKEKLLNQLPESWDIEKNGQWDGLIPDAYFSFDNHGLDRTPEGGYTGWRAYGYYPFLGTFWPTNGSTDDMLIRLAPAFWTDNKGLPSLEVYNLNFAIISALITRKDVDINTVDESIYGVDLNKDGILGESNKVVFDWAPTKGKYMSYVGQAKQQLEQGLVHIAAGLFPEGTEFLHSVRYLDVNDEDVIQLSARLKELRYAKKIDWKNYSELKGMVEREGFERAINPDQTKKIPGNYETGMYTQGWIYQAFIEDKKGDLRPQSQEEMLYCMGCHGGIGATTDTIFSYPRKVAHQSFQNGWYHWTQKGLKDIAEPKTEDGLYEYSLYLANNQSANEFRSNDEVQKLFFDDSGKLKADMINNLHSDISQLLIPSKERALKLNKAYWTIVKEQSFIFGRDGTIVPQKNVYQQVEQGRVTGIKKAIVSGTTAQ